MGMIAAQMTAVQEPIIAAGNRSCASAADQTCLGISMMSRPGRGELGSVRNIFEVVVFVERHPDTKDLA